VVRTYIVTVDLGSIFCLLHLYPPVTRKR